MSREHWRERERPRIEFVSLRLSPTTSWDFDSDRESHQGYSGYPVGVSEVDTEVDGREAIRVPRPPGPAPSPSLSSRSSSPSPCPSPSPSPSAWYATPGPIVDPGYTSGAFRVISRDGILFHLPRSLISQVPHFANLTPGETHHLTHASGDARALRLLLGLVQPREVRDAGNLVVLSRALRLGHYLGMWAACRLLGGYISAALEANAWGREAVHILALAGEVDDDALAEAAVLAMAAQCGHPRWEEGEIWAGAPLPRRLLWPASWSPEEYAAIKPEYTWAIGRAVLAGDVGSFAEFVEVYRGRAR